MKRGDAQSCAYAAPVVRTSKKAVTHANGSTGPDEMQKRVDKLESLVLGLIQSNAQGQYGLSLPAEVGVGLDASIRQGKDGPEDVTMVDAGAIISGEQGLAQVRHPLDVLGAEQQKPSYLRDTDWTSVLKDVGE